EPLGISGNRQRCLGGFFGQQIIDAGLVLVGNVGGRRRGCGRYPQPPVLDGAQTLATTSVACPLGLSCSVDRAGSPPWRSDRWRRVCSAPSCRVACGRAELESFGY